MLNVATTAGPGGILALIRSGEAVTRAQIMAVTGLSRSTVAQRLDALIAHGYIAPAATESSTGGRPAGAFQINANAGNLHVGLLSSIDWWITLPSLAHRCRFRREESIPLAKAGI